ncbi:FUN14 domain-containing protein 1-like [Amphiura filiformis]|uniref:FUN14 domain-containing protein 1-like n=1 Tax=Amphiura filiformis TaxID=82378 RepID=UPI003B222D2D
MASAGGDNKDETFEVLEVAEAGRHWLERALNGELSKKSVPVQVGIGGGTGMVAGYVCQKVGKAAATAVGGGFLLILLGHHAGYVKVNWKRFEKDVDKVKKDATEEMEKRATMIQGIIDQTKELARKNIFISSGFAAGFLLGMSV